MIVLQPKITLSPTRETGVSPKVDTHNHIVCRYMPCGGATHKTIRGRTSMSLLASPRCLQPDVPGLILLAKSMRSNEGVLMAENSTRKKVDARQSLRTNEQKWTKPLMDAGWVAFPSVILEKQHAIGLTPTDINIILHLATYWWTAENKAHPSKRSIALALNVTPRTVQRRIAAMERAGFIKREERRILQQGSKTNLYHFDGLIEAATPFAQEKIEVRARRKEEDKDRQRRKRPHLQVVPNSDEE